MRPVAGWRNYVKRVLRQTGESQTGDAPEYEIRLLEHVFGEEEQAQAHKLALQYLYRFETRLTVGGAPLRGSYVLDEVFSPTYSIARDRFCKAAGDAGARLEELDLDVSGPDNEKLTINIAWLGAKHPKRLLLHTSGIHCVEGFAGSAIQTQLVKRPPPLSDDEALVIVHGINAYGMSCLRRCNENNVDLNRNFLGPSEQYEGAPDGYHKLHALLNSETPPASLDPFLLRLPGCGTI